MHYAYLQQFILIYLSMHILTKFTKKKHVIHFSNNKTQNGPNIGPIENRTPLGPFTVHHQIIGIPKHTTNPKDISSGIKTKLQYSPGLLENSPENPVRAVRKKSRKFSSNCAKTVLNFSPDYPKTILKIPTLSPKNWGLKFMAFHDL